MKKRKRADIDDPKNIGKTLALEILQHDGSLLEYLKDELKIKKSF